MKEPRKGNGRKCLSGTSEHRHFLSYVGDRMVFTISSNPLSPSTSLRIERSYIFDKLGLLPPPPPRNPISNASFADLNNDSLTGSYVNFSLEIPSLYSSSGIVLPVSLSSSVLNV